MMAQVQQLPRPLLIALVGAALAAVMMVATRGGGSESSSTGSPAPATQAQTTGTPGSGTQSQSSAGSGEQGSATASQPNTKSKPRTLPADVDRALDAKKVVVLLLWNPKGADDQSVKQALSGVSSHGGKVAKFNDTLGNLARYTRITGTQSVNQTPAVVVVDRKGNGQVATGYLDSASLDQLVVDALR
jgi:hypothetical protein